jgi:hypothetical protein
LFIAFFIEQIKFPPAAITSFPSRKTYFRIVRAPMNSKTIFMKSKRKTPLSTLSTLLHHQKVLLYKSILTKLILLVKLFFRFSQLFYNLYHPLILSFMNFMAFKKVNVYSCRKGLLHIILKIKSHLQILNFSVNLPSLFCYYSIFF